MDPINEGPCDYQAYLLRLWRTQHQGQTQWRASLESPHTGEHQSFASLEQCFAYLKEQFRSGGDVEKGGPGNSKKEKQ